MCTKISLIFLILASLAFADDASEFIVGGRDASLGQFPHMVSLRRELFRGSTETRHSCGGGVISTRWILTAAHCIDDYWSLPKFAVVGAVRLEDPGEVYNISGVFPHPDFGRNRIWHDIGLVKVATDIIFGRYVQPIPLNRIRINNPTRAQLSGYGHYLMDLEEIRLSPHLQYKNTTILTHFDCVARTALAGVIVPEYQPIISLSHVCTLAQRGIGGCFGDSGSVLVARGRAVGIVSTGLSCARGAPDLLARVSSYTRWLDETMRRF